MKIGNQLWRIQYQNVNVMNCEIIYRVNMMVDQ